MEHLPTNLSGNWKHGRKCILVPITNKRVKFPCKISYRAVRYDGRVDAVRVDLEYLYGFSVELRWEPIYEYFYSELHDVKLLATH